MKNKNQGITLVAVIITVIVLLILAGVSIATLTGENGILTKAGTAKEDTQRASAIEQAKVDILAWQTERLGKNQDATLSDDIIKDILTGKDYVKDGEPGLSSFITAEGEHEISYSELYKKSEKVIVDGVTIPKGFYHVAGTTKNDGLVISDVEGDDLDNSKGENQFVWVPVEEGEFKRSDWENWDEENEPTDLTDSEEYI